MVEIGAGLSEPFVRRLEAFGLLSNDDKAVLREITANAHSVGSRSDLIREGEPPNGVILILKGFASRYKILSEGSRQIIAYLLPGDFCDLDGGFLSRMDHSIGTLSRCQVVRIAPSAVLDLLKRPAIARALRMATLLEMANAREWLVNVGQRSATKRLAHLFCELLVRMEVIGATNENAYDMPLSQRDLCDALGMSYVHMNRAIGELKSAGLIDLRRKRLAITDLQGLKIFGDFQSDYLHLEGGSVSAKYCSL